MEQQALQVMIASQATDQLCDDCCTAAVKSHSLHYDFDTRTLRNTPVHRWRSVSVQCGLILRVYCFGYTPPGLTLAYNLHIANQAF